MNIVIKFPKLPEKITVDNHVEATPDGINFMHVGDNSVYQHARLLGYSSAIRQLDEGAYDWPICDGFNVIAEIGAAHSKGWFSPSVNQQIIIWRWTVAAVFFVEQIAKGCIVDAPEEDGSTTKTVAYISEHGSMPVVPFIERISLANHIDATALEHYPQAQAPAIALAVYQSMLEEDTESPGMRLSEWGSHSLIKLHEDFLCSIASGEAEQRVLH